MEVGGAECLAGHEWVDGDGQDAGLLGAFGVEHVELVDDHMSEIWAGEPGAHQRRQVVDLERVGELTRPGWFSAKG